MSRLACLVLVLFTFGCGREVPPPVVDDTDLPDVIVPPPTNGGDDTIPPPREVLVRSRAEAMAVGVSYLLKHQAADGAWRSDVYATFKDGTAQTPQVVVTLQEAYDGGARIEEVEAAITKGCAYLAAFVKDGAIVPPEGGFEYPVYTAALALKAFSHPTAKEFAKHGPAWAAFLKQRQLTSKLGWKEEEKEYGGWGYCRVVPKKPEPGAFAPPLIESNISATLFALDALSAADALDAETAKAAAVFLRRVQNKDGGFHFIYDDPVRNKAGAMPGGFHSYGSTTADGLLALALCNDPADKKRLEAARAWLVAKFNPEQHPGEYVAAHESNRDAVYYYYSAGAAKALRDQNLELPDNRDWRAELSFELARRQHIDGSWSNPIEMVRENDPIVATTFAIQALARCR